jgi:hypothetical protein
MKPGGGKFLISGLVHKSRHDFLRVQTLQPKISIHSLKKDGE